MEPVPLADLRVVHEGSDDTAGAALASLAVHHHHVLRVRVQPRLHGAADGGETLQGGSQVVGPPKVQHLFGEERGGEGGGGGGGGRGGEGRGGEGRGGEERGGEGRRGRNERDDERKERGSRRGGREVVGEEGER